ncbi:SAM-dependent methyltransferase [Cellulomonas denverensis]|uniref:Class I SAM-dependent methyltransferase n=1 Tax=Cellulomonas denverensis TaxID=264297 RepID=A0A7X6KU40_9CELL|nr:class I SAM-dependent methyltransferase [Cellulomonas denverensis]NKY22033.1 class I SAM-dependent methyltransferase [Cellulomonas denverensis]GIG27228.1 hypothetical protein Cde04nite_34720 [Cellulomonas denverensis]
MDFLRVFSIRESTLRIHNPITADKLATLGRALQFTPGSTVLDLASGSGEMLCSWARDHAIEGTGVDLNAGWVDQATARAAELGVADRVRFVAADAAGYVAEQPVDVASCVGATWIGGGVAGTIELLSRSVRPGGMLLIGEPFWTRVPEDQATAEACGATSADDFRTLPGLLEEFDELGFDTVEMMLADQDSWDRYMAPQWLAIRRWLDQNPQDELAPQLRETLATEPARYARYQREYLGWGVFALIARDR